LANVSFTWTNPVSSPDPIAHYRIERNVSGQPASVVADNIPAVDEAFLAADEPNGAFIYRLVSVSADGDESSGATLNHTGADIVPSNASGFAAANV
jgi:hypothetical protein